MSIIKQTASQNTFIFSYSDKKIQKKDFKSHYKMTILVKTFFSQRRMDVVGQPPA